MAVDINIKEWGARFLTPFGEDKMATCDICGDCHEPDNMPISCETGDGE